MFYLNLFVESYPFDSIEIHPKNISYKEHEIEILENELSAEMTGKMIGHTSVLLEKLNDTHRIAS